MENRDIKFRALCNYDETSGMVYFEAAQCDNGVFCMPNPNNIQHIHEYLSPLMQYTGLKNKAGKEVFEGDILRFPAKDDWEKINYISYEVFFHDGGANSDYNIGYSINRMHYHGSACGGYIPSFKPKTINKMETIGTIYSNPTLI